MHKELSDEIKSKNNLTDDTFNLIAWEPISKMLKSTAHSRNIKVMKIIHEKWITHYEQHKMKQHANGFCPNCGHHIEKTEHVFQCSNTEFQTGKKQLDMRVIKTINGGIVPDTFVSLIHSGLCNPDQQHEKINLIEMVEPALRSLTLQAFKEQTEIGWNLLNKGLISKTWVKVIELKAKNEKAKFSLMHSGNEAMTYGNYEVKLQPSLMICTSTTFVLELKRTYNTTRTIEHYWDPSTTSFVIIKGISYEQNFKLLNIGCQ